MPKIIKIGQYVSQSYSKNKSGFLFWHTVFITTNCISFSVNA